MKTLLLPQILGNEKKGGGYYKTPMLSFSAEPPPRESHCMESRVAVFQHSLTAQRTGSCVQSRVHTWLSVGPTCKAPHRPSGVHKPWTANLPSGLEVAPELLFRWWDLHR